MSTPDSKPVSSARSTTTTTTGFHYGLLSRGRIPTVYGARWWAS